MNVQLKLKFGANNRHVKCNEAIYQIRPKLFVEHVLCIVIVVQLGSFTGTARALFINYSSIIDIYR
jgi:hypothetical protein